MKIIFLFILLGLINKAFAQFKPVDRPTCPDTMQSVLWNDPMGREKQIYCQAFHTGVNLMVAGGIGTALSSILITRANTNNERHIYTGAIIASSFFMVVGSIITLDAYKHIKSNNLYLKSTNGQVAIGVKF